MRLARPQKQKEQKSCQGILQGPYHKLFRKDIYKEMHKEMHKEIHKEIHRNICISNGKANKTQTRNVALVAQH